MTETQIGYIYKLTCSETGDIYYGSTTQTLQQRLWKHKSHDNNCVSKKFINPTIEELCQVEFIEGDKTPLLAKEKEYIVNNKCVNLVVPLRTRQEYYKYRKSLDPRFGIRKYCKIEGKLYNDKTRVFCECGGHYVKRNRKKHLLTHKHSEYLLSD